MTLAFLAVAVYLLTFVVGGLTGAVAGYYAGKPKPEHVAKQLGAAYDSGYAAGHNDAEDDLLDKADALFECALEDEPDGHV